MNKSEFKNPIIWVILGLFIVASIFIISGIVTFNFWYKQLRFRLRI